MENTAILSPEMRAKLETLLTGFDIQQLHTAHQAYAFNPDFQEAFELVETEILRRRQRSYGPLVVTEMYAAHPYAG